MSNVITLHVFLASYFAGLRSLAFETNLSYKPWTMQIVQSFKRLEKLLSRRNMYPAIKFDYLMRLCAHMHSQSEHVFVKINKRDGTCVSSLHETISLFK